MQNRPPLSLSSLSELVFHIKCLTSSHCSSKSKESGALSYDSFCLHELMEMPACRLVQQTYLLATASLPLIFLPSLIKCFVCSQFFGHSYLIHIKLVASGWEVCLPSLRCLPGSLHKSLKSSPCQRFWGNSHWKLLELKQGARYSSCRQMIGYPRGIL